MATTANQFSVVDDFIIFVVEHFTECSMAPQKVHCHSNIQDIRRLHFHPLILVVFVLKLFTCFAL